MSRPAHPPTLGVVLPTRNAMPALHRHLDAMRRWWARAAEIVVVDSDSSDGTVAFLQREVQHPAVQILHHPPGLYASWNHGIRQVTAEFVYISTVGDTITPEGMEDLVRTAVSLDCDVVISPPGFVDPAGRAVPGRRWPIVDIMATLAPKEPRRLQPLEALLFAAWGVPDALTGSCASCLFRTRALQARPFRTDVGTAADGLWCAEHVMDLRWGVLPECVSTFVVHPTYASESDRRRHAHMPRLDAALERAARSAVRRGMATAADLASIGWDELHVALTQWMDYKDAYDTHRRGAFPWILRPAAWRARSARNRARACLLERRRAGMHKLQDMRSGNPRAEPNGSKGSE